MHTCNRCNRKLTTTKSIELGYGPTCYKKHLRDQADADFLKRQITIDEVMQHDIQRTIKEPCGATA